MRPHAACTYKDILPKNGLREADGKKLEGYQTITNQKKTGMTLPSDKQTLKAAAVHGNEGAPPDKADTTKEHPQTRPTQRAHQLQDLDTPLGNGSRA